MAIDIRVASRADLDVIRTIYNEGIEDRTATLDTALKSNVEMSEWWSQHTDAYTVIVATELDRVVGWASLNRFSHRCAHAGIADLSVYVSRRRHGQGIGLALLCQLIQLARASGFHKIVLYALDLNERGKRLYRNVGFALVGVFREHGQLDGRFVDVIAMELLLK